jgi:hypothetical protein
MSSFKYFHVFPYEKLFAVTILTGQMEFGFIGDYNSHLEGCLM